MPARSHRRRRRRRIVKRVSLAILLVAIGFAGWCSLDLIKARSELTAARAHLSAAGAALGGDPAIVDRELTSAADASAAAQIALQHRPLGLLRHIPLMGEPFQSVTSIADILADVTRTALPPAAQGARSLTAAPLLDMGRVDLDAVRASQNPFAAADSAALDATRRAREIPAHTWLPPVDDIRDQFVDQLTRLTASLGAARTATELVPGMLGGERKRTYLVALQNNAEARGTGGLVGGFLLFSADRGKITLVKVVKDLALPPEKPINLGDDYQNLYGSTDPTEIWQNSNQSPHFPYAARIWRSLARQLTGITPDVVIGIDPPGLRSILTATGPIPLPGGGFATPDNIVALTESQAYAQFDDARADRKTYLADIAEATFQRITGGQFQITALATAFSDAANDGRIAVWSQDPGEQAVLAGTPLGHEVPFAPGPYANVVVNNAYGSKLDYYLARTIRYRYGTCTDDRQQVFVDVTLNNGVGNQDLSPEVLGTYLPGGGSLPLRTNRVTVSLYSSWGARLRSLSVNGDPVGYGQGDELGHPVNYAVVELPPQTPVTLEFELNEPRSDDTPDIPVQALTNPARVQVSNSPCAG